MLRESVAGQDGRCKGNSISLQTAALVSAQKPCSVAEATKIKTGFQVFMV